MKILKTILLIILLIVAFTFVISEIAQAGNVTYRFDDYGDFNYDDSVCTQSGDYNTYAPHTCPGISSTMGGDNFHDVRFHLSCVFFSY